MSCSVDLLTMHDAISALEAFRTSSLVEDFIERDVYCATPPQRSLFEVLCSSDALDELRAVMTCNLDAEMLCNEVLPSQLTPMETAVSAGAVRISRWLVDYFGASLEPQLLLRAARGRKVEHWKIVTWLAEHISVQESDPTDGTTVLHLACSLQEPLASEMAQFLVRKGADVNATTAEDETPLLIALRAKNYALAAWLASAAGGGAAVLCKSRMDGETPLSLAVSDRQLELVHLFLAAAAHGDGADAAQDTRAAGESLLRPLCLAAAQGSLECVRLLANVAEASELAAAARSAAGAGQLDVLKLLAKGPAYSSTDAAGLLNGALHDAAGAGREEVVRWLLDECKVAPDGENLSAEATETPTPLMLAARGGHKAVMSALLSRGADVRLRDGNRNWTALEWACAGPEDCFDRRAGDLAVVRFLMLEAGAEFVQPASSKCSGDSSSSSSRSSASRSGCSQTPGATLGHTSGSALHAAARTAWKARERNAEIACYLLGGSWVDSLLAIAFPGAVIPALGKPLPRDVETALRSLLVPDAAAAVRAKDAEGRTPLEVALRVSSSTGELFAALVEAGAPTDLLDAQAQSVVRRALRQSRDAKSGVSSQPRSAASVRLRALLPAGHGG